MDTRTKSLRGRRGFVLAVGLASTGLGGWYVNQSHHEDPMYQSATVMRGELTQCVTATGQLNPVTLVEVGSQISGVIQNLSVDFNSPVTNGQVIAQIDPATYEAVVTQTEGSLASAKAALELAQIEERRARELQANKLNSQDNYDNALAAMHQAQAAVTVNEGIYRKSRVDLSRCTISSPIDGIVISRNVNVGQTVAASLSAPTLFIIANDLTKMRIEAQVAESDIGNVEAGQDVNFTVDALPGQTFHGKVIQIRNTPTIDQNVVAYDTVIEAGNPNLKLKPGMTANVAIVTVHRDSVLKISNEALRFHPPATAKIQETKPLNNADTPANDSKGTSPNAHKKGKHKIGSVAYMLPVNGQSGGRDEQLRRVQIITGISDGNYTEVIEGLNEGDEIAEGIIPAKVASLHVAGFFSNAGTKH
jgi:HlyD family secretion protein